MAVSQSEKEHRFWNAVGLLLFVGLCAISFALIFSYGDFGVDHVGLLDLALLGLATFRLIHLISYDRVLDFARVLVMDSEGSRLKAADRGWRRVVCELMECLWCAGLWSALIVVTAYAMGNWGRLGTLLLAVAGLGSLLQVISKAVAIER
ncbi:MAG: DUF1360 domain-containing protein [Pseudolabrys sp.]|jgi:hypothetical protein